MNNSIACLALATLLPLVIARNLAQLGPDFLQLDEGTHEAPVTPSVALPVKTVESPVQDSSATAPLTRLASMLKQFTWQSIREKFNSLLSGESSTDDSWLVTFALAASLGFFAFWIWRRRSSRFEMQQEMLHDATSVHRKLFDDASSGKHSQLSWSRRQSHFLELFKSGMRWTACAAASLGIACLVLMYVDTRYIITGCFALIALAYDRQQNQVLKEGQLRLGIDSVP